MTGAPNQPVNNLILQTAGAVQTGVVQANGSSPAIASNTVPNVTLSGTPVVAGAVVTNSTAMGTTAINVAVPKLTRSLTGDETETFSNNTPTTGTAVTVEYTADASTRTITAPLSGAIWFYDLGTTGTTFTVDANSKKTVTYQRLASSWIAYGTGVSTTGTGAYVKQTGPNFIETSTSTPRGALFDQYSTGTNSAQINVRKARGTAAVPTTIVTGDVISRFIAWGYDGTNFIETGNLRFTSTGTIATNRVPSNFSLWVSTNAAPSVLTDVMDATATSVTFNVPVSGTYHSVGTAIVGAGGGVITTGIAHVPITVPFAGTISNIYIAGNASGSITIDVLRSASTAAAPSASMVGAGTKPVLTAAASVTIAAPSNWTSATFAAGDTVDFQVTTADAVLTAVTIILIYK